jgi:excinuclease ABC subunit A
VYAGFTPAQTRDALKRKLEPSYQGTFTGARRYILHTFTHSQSALMKKRVSQFMQGSPCPQCEGKRLNKAALSVKFAGVDIGELSQMSLLQLAELLRPVAEGQGDKKLSVEKRLAAQRIAQDLLERVSTLTDLGLGYLALERSTPTLSSGELQRLRLATQLGSQLFGVIYVLDEPSVRRPRPPEGRRQLAVRGGTRPGNHAPRRLADRRRPGCRRARRPSPVQRPTRRPRTD